MTGVSDIESTHETRTCTACKEQINVEATKCPKCQSYQTRWMNRVYPIATIGGLVLILGVLIYDLWPRFAWEPHFEVITFDSDSELRVLNLGKETLLMDSVTVRVPEEGFSETIPVTAKVDRDAYAHAQLNRRRAADIFSIPELLGASGQDSQSRYFRFYSQDFAYPKDQLMFKVTTVDAECTINIRSTTTRDLVEHDFPCIAVVREFHFLDGFSPT